MEHDNALRAWARGLLPLEAGTELLIRDGYAEAWRPWVRYDETARRPWIDFSAIPDAIGGMVGGQQRFLRIAASLGADSPIILGDEIPGLDRNAVALVLAAVSHAAGVDQGSHYRGHRWIAAVYERLRTVRLAGSILIKKI